MRKVDCEFHFYGRHEWNNVLIDYTEEKLKKCVATSRTDDERRSWQGLLDAYRMGIIIAGWDKGHFVWHNIVKESK